MPVSSRQQHPNRTVHGVNIDLHHPTMHHSITIFQAHARSRGHGACRRYRNVHGCRSRSHGAQPIISHNVSSCVSVWCASLRLPAQHSLLSPTERLLLRKWLESLGDSTNWYPAAWHLVPCPPGPRPFGPDLSFAQANRSRSCMSKPSVSINSLCHLL